MASDTEQNEADPFRFQADAVKYHRRLVEDRAEAIRVAYSESDRDRFWFAVKIALLCVLWCCLGALPMAWALHTTDMERAKIAWAVGPLLANVLIVGTLVFAASRWEREGWH